MGVYPCVHAIVRTRAYLPVNDSIALTVPSLGSATTEGEKSPDEPAGMTP